MKSAWMLVYMLILTTMIALFFLINGLERRRAQETISPSPLIHLATPRTTIGVPETTTPRPTP